MTEKENLFIEYTFEGIEIIDWQNFVNKWKLKIITNSKMLSTDDTTKKCTAYNDDYTICMTGDSIFYITDELKKEEPSVERPEIDEPADIISLIMSDKIEAKLMLSFLNDFINLTKYIEDIDFDIHENQNKNTIHPYWILDRM